MSSLIIWILIAFALVFIAGCVAWGSIKSNDNESI